MIDLQQYKSNKLAKFNQLIVLDLSGRLIQSCNSIFDVSVFLNHNILKEFPFIESIFEVIKGLKVTDSELLFSKVESASSILKGIYDFTFLKLVWKEEEFILWSIYDFTALYRDLIDYQQRRNELEINRQYREQLLNLFAKDGKKQPYLVEMVAALRQKNSYNTQAFNLEEAVESVKNAFAYQAQYTFQPYQISGLTNLNGDITWLKFLLYNILESLLTTFKSASINFSIQSHIVEKDVFVSFRITFNGKTINPQLLEVILGQEEELIGIKKLSSKEHYIIPKLYNVQKTVHQQNGYLELQQIDEKFENIKAVLLCNFNFKR